MNIIHKNRVTTADFIKNYGTLADKALREPVTITKNGKDRLVMLSVEEFENLLRSYRRVVRIKDLADEEMALMEQQLTEAAETGDPALNAELEGWKP